jgi:hypothetical protein
MSKLAFPQNRDLNDTGENPLGGMTLREYYAGLAMQAWITLPATNGDFFSRVLSKAGLSSPTDAEDFISKLAFDQADSMIRQIQK